MVYSKWDFRILVIRRKGLSNISYSNRGIEYSLFERELSDSDYSRVNHTWKFDYIESREVMFTFHFKSSFNYLLIKWLVVYLSKLRYGNIFKLTYFESMEL